MLYQPYLLASLQNLIPQPTKRHTWRQIPRTIIFPRNISGDSLSTSITCQETNNLPLIATLGLEAQLTLPVVTFETPPKEPLQPKVTRLKTLASPRRSPRLLDKAKNRCDPQYFLTGHKMLGLNHSQKKACRLTFPSGKAGYSTCLGTYFNYVARLRTWNKWRSHKSSGQSNQRCIRNAFIGLSGQRGAINPAPWHCSITYDGQSCWRIALEDKRIMRENMFHITGLWN